jgi:serine/threonine protein kinase/tetratricopeptide (TPR) repeat protein
MDLALGARLGPYEILTAIGAGGMGRVYRARDGRLSRDVAIKVLSHADADLLARFEREARAMAVLSHPNIVTIFDVGTYEGSPFLVSELLDGRTLRDVLADGPLPVARAGELALQLVRGVAAAHALKIIHRDLKPENLFLTRDGTLKILDFGLAKLEAGPLGDADETRREVSGERPFIGTPAYMAPEQLRGEPVDERADLFAIGTIVHEMVAGGNPFRRPSTADTIAAILREVPPEIDAREDVTPGLERVIRRCLEKDPADRFQTAGDLAFAMESLVGAGAPRGRGRLAPLAREGPRGGPPAPSVAVLPFADMSPTRDQDWLCEGMAEELIDALTHIEGLRVAARSSSFQFRTPGVDIQAVGARLGVGSVLEGSVRKVGERLRVTVQLVSVEDGYHRWSRRFDRTLADVFDIQDEIAQNVVSALRGILTHSERAVLRRPETSAECYEYFLRGRRLTHRFDRVALETAKPMFERAIEIDPGYALAHAGLADVHSWFYEWWGGAEADLEAADRASQRALDLAPDLSEANSSRGFVLSLRRRYEEATQAFEAAIRLNPHSFDAHYLYARACFASGKIGRSAELFRRAGGIRQEDFQSLVLLSQSLRVLGRADEADEANREAVRRVERLLELDPTDARALSLGALALDDDGQRERALGWSRRALELHPNDQGVLINGACLFARAGGVEEALDLLERTFARGFGKRDWIEHDPDYDSLRAQPRFQAMLSKLR